MDYLIIFKDGTKTIIEGQRDAIMTEPGLFVIYKEKERNHPEPKAYFNLSELRGVIYGPRPGEEGNA